MICQRQAHDELVRSTLADPALQHHISALKRPRVHLRTGRFLMNVEGRWRHESAHNVDVHLHVTHHPRRRASGVSRTPLSERSADEATYEALTGHVVAHWGSLGKW